MAATLDLTEFDAAMKEYYTDERIHNLTYRNNPFLAMVPKREDFYGDSKPIVVEHGNPQGRSRTFSTAKANKQAGKRSRFMLTRVKDYGYITIDNETIEASRNDRGAFLDARTVEINGMLRELTQSLAISLYRDSSGYRGQVSAEPDAAANTVITLKQAQDVHNFEVGQTINIWSAKSGGSQRTSDGSTTDLVIDAIDRSAGTITATGQAYDGSGTIAANDYIFVEGDRGNSISGLEGWVPDTAPTSGDSFFGLDRSVDTDRLAGVRVDGTGKPVEEALIEAASELELRGGNPDYCFMPFAKWNELEKSLGSKVSYVNLEAPGKVGFRGIQIAGNSGPITVLADRNCPAGKAFMVEMDTWCLDSLGKAPRLFDTDGRTMLRQSDADGVEVRALYYAQLGCRAPGRNANIDLD